MIVLQSPSQGSSRVRGIAIRARLGDVDSFEVTDVRNRLSQALEEVGPVANPLVGEPGLRISGPETMSAACGITDQSGEAREERIAAKLDPNSIWVRASRNTRPQWFVGSCIVNWSGASIDRNVQRFFECSEASLADDRRHDFRRRHRRPLLARRHRSYCQGHHAGLVVDQLSDKLRWRDDGNATLPK